MKKRTQQQEGTIKLQGKLLDPTKTIITINCFFLFYQINLIKGTCTCTRYQQEIDERNPCIRCVERNLYEQKHNITTNPQCFQYILQHQLSSQNKGICKRQIVSPKYLNLKKILYIYFKRKLNIFCCFHILAEYSQPQNRN